MIQSVERAAGILRALASGRASRVSELSDRLGLAKGTIHGLLRTLQDQGLVEQDPVSDKYQLGPQLLQLGNRYLDLNECGHAPSVGRATRRPASGKAVRVGTLHDGTACSSSTTSFALTTACRNPRGWASAPAAARERARQGAARVRGGRRCAADVVGGRAAAG